MKELEREREESKKLVSQKERVFRDTNNKLKKDSKTKCAK